MRSTALFIIRFLILIFSYNADAFMAPHLGRSKIFYFNTNTTITSSNVAKFTNRDWIIKSGVTVTINYSSNITLGNLTMLGTSVITHTQCTANPCALISLTIVGNATIPSGASINANGKGYLGGNSGTNSGTTGVTNGLTTTGGSLTYAGGSHGGYGGYYSTVPAQIPATPYDSVIQPVLYGGGGGSKNVSNPGGNGGGVVYLNVSGNLTLEGSIDVGGQDVDSSSGSGGGSGGSIWVQATTITSSSTNGIFIAYGGDCLSGGTHGSGGGGGRIAIYYTNLGGSWSIDTSRIRPDGGSGDGGFNLGGSGTAYIKPSGSTYGDVIFYAGIWTQNSFYLETPFPQDVNRTFRTITVNGAKVKQLSTATSITATTTAVGSNGSYAGVLSVPTNGAAGYGSWFVPGTTSLTGGGTIVEY